MQTNPPPHVLRMQVEFDDLQSRLARLTAFINGPALRDLAVEDQCLLFTQYSVMGLYADTLEKRLARATPPS
jgi:hypothetical protein